MARQKREHFMPMNNNRNEKPKGAAAAAADTAQTIRRLKLDPTTEAFLERNLAQITSINQGINGALSLIIAQNSLPGNWTLDWPNRQMICTDPEAPGAGVTPAAVPATQQPAAPIVNGVDPAAEDKAAT
jgi:hypothetical protein